MRPRTKLPQRDIKSVFPTRSHSWSEVGLARHVNRAAVKRARIQIAVLVPFAAGILLADSHRKELFRAFGTAVRAVTVVALLAVGWGLARSVGRVLGPSLFRRMDPATAGARGVLIPLVAMCVALMVALRIAGVRPRELAVGGAFTAVVVGLAAQQTLGNLFAGTVLLSARPFRVGERVRLQGGGLAGTVEGTVSSLGLLYTVLSQGEEEIMVPHSVVLNVAIVPLREPDAVDMRARLRPGVTPSDIQSLLEDRIDVPTRDRPRIVLEELDDEEVVVRIQATPVKAEDGPHLATEVLGAIAAETRRSDDGTIRVPPDGGGDDDGARTGDSSRSGDGVTGVGARSGG